MRRLVVIPSDPLQAYVDAGYPDLTNYYNPKGFFDEVYALSPFESVKRKMYGMWVIPTSPEEFQARIKKLKIDLVRAYGGHWPCDLATHLRTPGVPVVVSVHDPDPGHLHNSLQGADKVFAVSNVLARMVIEKGVSPHRVRILPNRVDLSLFFPRCDPVLQKAFDNRFPGRFKILFVGRKTKQKNPDTLIKALSILGDEYVGIFIGRGNSEVYMDLARERGIIDRSHFIEGVPNAELVNFYNFSTCMCTPSRWEGFGTVFIEAMASGAVVVTSDIAPMNEFIADGETGILVKDYENPQSLARCIELACRDESLREKIRVNAPLCVEKFSKERIDDLESGYYNELLEEESLSKKRNRSLRQEMEVVDFLMDISVEWDAFVRNSNGAWLFHLADWQRLLPQTWNDILYSFAVIWRNKVVGIMPLFQSHSNRARLVSTTMGPAGPALADDLEPAVRQAVLEHIYYTIRRLAVKNKNAILDVFLHPLAPASVKRGSLLWNPLLKWGFLDTSTQTYIIDLSKSLEEIWANFRSVLRYDIRKAEKFGYEVRLATSMEDIEDYYHMHVETYNRTGVSPHPFEYFQLIWEYFGVCSLANFFIAYKDGAPVAALNVATYKEAALHWTGASKTEFMKTGVNKLLQWEAIKWCKERGFLWYESGEAFPETKEGKHAGLDFFKRSFGGVIYPFYKGRLILK